MNKKSAISQNRAFCKDKHLEVDVEHMCKQHHICVFQVGSICRLYVWPTHHLLSQPILLGSSLGTKTKWTYKPGVSVTKLTLINNSGSVIIFQRIKLHRIAWCLISEPWHPVAPLPVWLTWSDTALTPAPGSRLQQKTRGTNPCQGQKKQFFWWILIKEKPCLEQLMIFYFLAPLSHGAHAPSMQGLWMQKILLGSRINVEYVTL